MTSDGTLRWLDDVLIIDVGDSATAWAGGLLAELGALVVRVEATDADEVRASRFDHLAANAGKVSLAVDFEKPGTWSLLLEGASKIDAVIGPLDPTHPGHPLVAALGDAGVPVVRSVFRRHDTSHLVTDLIVDAASGQMVLNGGPDDPPAHPAGDLAYKQTGLAAAEAALALVLSRRRTGHAGQIDLSAQEAVCFTTLQTGNGNHLHWHGRAPGRHVKVTDGSTVRSRDGKWTSFTIHGPNWPGFVEWVDQVLGPQGIEGPEWHDSQYAVINRHVVLDVIARMASALDQEDLLTQGQAHGLLLLPVQNLGQVADDRHLEARDFWEETVDSEARTIRIPGSPFRAEAGRARRGSAPAHGVGGVEALSQAGEPRLGSDAIDPRQPLAGIRIVDFCWAIAGPLTTRLLASLGAEVIKIESENNVDPIRYIGVQPEGTPSWDTNGVFQDTCPGKSAVTINVGTDEGKALVKDLIATADVVTANYTPDRMVRWGLGPADLEAVKSDIITVNMAVMGTHGPYRSWRSYGSGIVAMCGLAAHTGQPERLPECLGTLHTDFTVPYFAALQIMAALHQRSRTGLGAHIELSQYETAVRLLDAELTSVLNGGSVPERSGNRSATMAPHGAFPSAGDDRWLAVACRHEADWQKLASVIPSLAGLDRWRDLDVVEREVSTWTAARTNWEAATVLQTAGVPASPIEDLRDLYEVDPSTRNGQPTATWTEVALRPDLTGLVLHEPVLWNGARLPIRRSPTWFEHTFEVVVGEMGVDPERFAELVDKQVLW